MHRPSGKVQSSRVSSPGFVIYFRHVASLSKTLKSPHSRKLWLHLDWTENFFYWGVIKAIYKSNQNEINQFYQYCRFKKLSFFPIFSVKKVITEEEALTFSDHTHFVK